MTDAKPCRRDNKGALAKARFEYSLKEVTLIDSIRGNSERHL